MPAFAGMTSLEAHPYEVIPAKAGIQVQGSYQAVPDLFEKLCKNHENEPGT